MNDLGIGPGSTTDFDGTLEFVSATATAEDTMGLNVYYTSSTAIVLDPADPSNAVGGSTTWCDAPAGGTAVYGAGSCPASAAEVTGLRFATDPTAAPVDFPSGALVSYEVSLLPTGNAEGDVYSNCVMGRVVGLSNSVGPACADEFVVASAIGDYVWNDANGDGLQQSTESPYEGLAVHLTGTDSDGNAVSLDATTDADGNYLFAGLQSGSYVVTFDPASLKPGETFTVHNGGADDALDSDGDVTTGATATIALGVDVDDATIDQGVVVPVASPSPSVSPSESQTASPSVSPSVSPSESPSESPTSTPSASPSQTPSASPSQTPSASPSQTPSESPSASSTATPTPSPSESPSASPSVSPSESPSESPTSTPSPSETPSESPSETPSESPSETPTDKPTVTPSESPSLAPTTGETQEPSGPASSLTPQVAGTHTAVPEGGDGELADTGSPYLFGATGLSGAMLVGLGVLAAVRSRRSGQHG